MTKIRLVLKDLDLGDLSYQNSGYLWTPNVNNIDLAITKYPLNMEMFFLPIKTTHYKNVPAHYIDFLESADREDLANKAGIEEDDQDFVKLYKLAYLEFFGVDFIIKV